MFVRAYLRASTKEQDASRARVELEKFATGQGKKVASWYIEQESGTTLSRPELMRLISDAQQGDIILIEQVDRLARLKAPDWEKLKIMLQEKGLLIVSPELPTSWSAFQQSSSDSFTGAILQAVNGMLLDMLAAVARKDYDDRRRRQAEGIKKAQTEGKYKGRPVDEEKRARVKKLLLAGASYTDIQKTLACSRQLIANVKKELIC